jgi:hypothetical protein
MTNKYRKPAEIVDSLGKTSFRVLISPQICNLVLSTLGLEKSFPSTNEESYFKESKKQLEKLQLQLLEREMTPVFCMHELEFFTLHLCGSTAHVFGNTTHLKSCDKVEPLRHSNPRQRSAPLLLLLEMNSLVTLSPNNEALHCLLHLP